MIGATMVNWDYEFIDDGSKEPDDPKPLCAGCDMHCTCGKPGAGKTSCPRDKLWDCTDQVYYQKDVTEDEAQRQCYFKYGCPTFDPDNYICNGPVIPDLYSGEPVWRCQSGTECSAKGCAWNKKK